MRKDNKIHDVLGQQGEDKVSGIKGYITGVLEDAAGSIQYVIEGKKKGLFSALAESGLAIDYQQVVVKDLGKKRLEVAEAQPQFAIGERVRGTIIEVEGTIISRIRFVNGCIRCKIQPFDSIKEDDAIRIFEANLESIQDDEKYADKRDNRVVWNATGPALKLDGEEVVEETVVGEPKPVRDPARKGGPSQRLSEI